MSRGADIVRLPTAATNPVRQGGAVHAVECEGVVVFGRFGQGSPPQASAARSPAMIIALALLGTADEAWGRRALAFAKIIAEDMPSEGAAEAVAVMERTFGSVLPEVSR